jgi:hypothetical protein
MQYLFTKQKTPQTGVPRFVAKSLVYARRSTGRRARTFFSIPCNFVAAIVSVFISFLFFA